MKSKVIQNWHLEMLKHYGFTHDEWITMDHDIRKMYVENWNNPTILEITRKERKEKLNKIFKDEDLQGKKLI